MKKLLKLLFISTMVTIPVTSSVVLAACTFSMGDTTIAIQGINNNSIYIDAQVKPGTEEGTWESPRRNNKIVDINIKNPMKGYKIVPKLSNNMVNVTEGGVNKQVPLLRVEEINNSPGESNVSLRVTSDTFIDKDIEFATIEFSYFNEKTNSTITPDIKNKSISVQVHQVEVRDKVNLVDLSELKGKINSEYVYNFNSELVEVNRQNFLDKYVKEIVNSKIKSIKNTEFILGEHYEISLNDKNLNSNQFETEIDAFFNFNQSKDISVLIKSTGEENGDGWELDKKTEFSYVIKHDSSADLAPLTPGGTSPNEPARKYKLEELNLPEIPAYNFKDAKDEVKNLFSKNYVENFANDSIQDWSSREINSDDNYIVVLNNNPPSPYLKNFWEDPEQFNHAQVKEFLSRPEPEAGQYEEEIENPKISFEIKARDNQDGKITATGSKVFTFEHDDNAYTMPKVPGQPGLEEFIDIRFNSMFDGAPIDLSGMGEGNETTALLKEGLGGLILDKPIRLSNTEAIKTSVDNGFNVFHSEITKPETIENYVMNKDIGNPSFDDNKNKIKEKFVKIISDKNNWTVNFWKHMGSLGTNEKEGWDIDPSIKENQLSNISYALTVSAKKELKDDLKILTFTDSFQFPMYVATKAAPDKKWNDYFGSDGFNKYYGEDQMGLVLGSTKDFLNFVPKRDGEPIDDDETLSEMWAYNDILSQQALGVFDVGGLPGTDPTFYLTSGADYSISEKRDNREYDFTLQKSDVFDEVENEKKFTDIRPIYANDILMKAISTWSRARFSSGTIPDEIIGKFVERQLKVQYDINNWDGNINLATAKPIEIGEKIDSVEFEEGPSTKNVVENAYLLDLTKDDLSWDGGDSSISFSAGGEQLQMFDKALLGEGGKVPTKVDFNDPNGKVGIKPEQEENWLKWNLYNQTHVKRGNALTLPLLQPNDYEINEIGNTDEGVSYLYINTYNSIGNGSELSDKSIRHFVIKIKNR
ncbi:hypothetical protein [Spiroplasma endosymbiont of Othius punctulatus]|uniref:hypothetical protein n=1 Tax=Spiroplasma endosymbiont of Othius punctulatus TaxID=3066289 RepID=UPI0030CC2112